MQPKQPVAPPFRPMAPTTSPREAAVTAPSVRPNAPVPSPAVPVIPMTGAAASARPALVVMPTVVTAQNAAVGTTRTRGPFVQMPVKGAAIPEVEPVPGCPPGLEYLTCVDQLLVHQQLQLLEIFVPYEQRNRYVVKNTMSQFVFTAIEECDLATRCCCGSNRPFEMSLNDYRDIEVMRLFRPLRCDSCCCFCCLQEMEICAPPGTVIGWLRQDCTVIFPMFSVLDSDKNVVLQIQGPFCTTALVCNDIVFDVTTRDGKTKIGQITKNWSGLLREAFTDIDNFTLAFPIDLDVKMKAVLLGAVFLIDFMYFENGAAGPITGFDAPGNF
ncbi:phospholipid scramblase 2-like [Rhipicephalus microplus]|uniref:phospholipid scramblase 2-like n=1 Tax=Rhipicephalus microplus TaxID=6941 RepID=UPI003F6B6614